MTLPRLLHVFSTFDPGGPEVRTANFINATQDCFRHYVLAMDGRYGALSRIGQEGHVEVLPRPPIVPQDIANLIGPIRAPVVLWRLFRNALWIRKLLKSVQPSLMLTYNLGAASAMLAARMSNSCPVIHTETGFAADEIVRQKPARVLLRRWSAKNVSALVVPSRVLERAAEMAFRLRTPVIRIPNGVDTRKLKPADGGAMRQQLRFDPADFVIGCVGHFRAEKGHLRLFKALLAAEIPNAKLLLLGDGPMRPTLEKATTDMGIASRVVFTGSVDNVTSYYSAMDVFALASDSEQMPMALLEAMSCGLPVVCTDVGDCREIVGIQLVPSIFAVDDVIGYATALRRFSCDERLRRETGMQNRRRCIEEYDSDQMFSHYRDLYIRTISGNGRQLRI
jgi:glycosyltransferase involved in cell wall biosynthesis